MSDFEKLYRDSTDGPFDPNAKVSRARFLAMAGTGFAALAGLSGTALSGTAFAAPTPTHGSYPLVKGGTLNWYTFTDYVSSKDIQAYEKATGTSVNTAIYPSPDLSVSKFELQGPAVFDLMICTGSFVPIFIQKGWLRKLDKTNIPWQNIDRGLLGKFYDPTNDYTVPRSYGVGGIVYDIKLTKRPVHTWADFFEFTKLPGVQGNVLWSPSPSQLFASALLALGISINTTKVSDIMLASKYLQKYVGNIRAFGDWTAQNAADPTIAMAAAASAEVIPALTVRPTLRYVTPTPKSTLWIDNFCLCKGPNVDQAYSYINYEYQPARQLQEAIAFSLPSPLPGLNKAKQIKDPELLFSDSATLARCDVPVINDKIQAIEVSQFEQVQASAP